MSMTNRSMNNHLPSYSQLRPILNQKSPCCGVAVLASALPCCPTAESAVHSWIINSSYLLTNFSLSIHSSWFFRENLHRFNLLVSTSSCNWPHTITKFSQCVSSTCFFFFCTPEGFQLHHAVGIYSTFFFFFFVKTLSVPQQLWFHIALDFLTDLRLSHCLTVILLAEDRFSQGLSPGPTWGTPGLHTAQQSPISICGS